MPPGRSLKKISHGRKDNWIYEDRPPVFAGSLDTERGPLEESPRAPRFFFAEAAGRGFFEPSHFIILPGRPMFRPVISASSSSLRSLPAPVRLSGPVFRSSLPVSLLAPRSGHPPWSVSLFPCSCLPQSTFLASRSGHPPGQFLYSPVLTRPSQLFWSRAPVIPLVSFSIPLFWPIPGLLFWASRSSLKW